MVSISRENKVRLNNHIQNVPQVERPRLRSLCGSLYVKISDADKIAMFTQVSAAKYALIALNTGNRVREKSCVYEKITDGWEPLPTGQYKLNLEYVDDK